MSHLSNYQVIYLITNIFGTYIIYKFMGVFFERSPIRKYRELLAYAGYFIIISLVHLVIAIPMLTMVCNMAGFWLLSLNYHSTPQKRIVAVMLIYLVLMSVEVIVAVLLGYLHFSLLDSAIPYASEIGLIVIKLASYSMVLALAGYHELKNGEPIPLAYWVTILLIPSMTLAMILLTLQLNTLTRYQMLAYLVGALLINVLIFYIYDAVKRLSREDVRQMILQQEIEAYRNMLEIRMDAYNRTRDIYHDTQNHLQVFEAYLQKNQLQEGLAYLEQYHTALATPNEIAQSGHLGIDSLINFKYRQALDQDITMDVTLTIPESLALEAFDVVNILGNLLDNAIEAASQCTDHKAIVFNMCYDRGLLFITISNTYQGEIKYAHGNPVTTKKDKGNHGLGLAKIRAGLDKFHGSMEIQTENNIFRVLITMYI